MSIYSSSLLKVATYSVWCVFRAYASTIKQESDCGHLLALSLAKGIHQLLELGGTLDLEENFIIVVGHLDIQVFRRSSAFFRGHGDRLILWKSWVSEQELAERSQGAYVR